MKKYILYYLYNFLRNHTYSIFFIDDIESLKNYIKNNHIKMIDNLCLLFYYSLYEKNKQDMIDKYKYDIMYILSNLSYQKPFKSFNKKIMLKIINDLFSQFKLYDKKYVKNICKDTLYINDIGDSNINEIADEVIKFFKFAVQHIYSDDSRNIIGKYIKNNS